MKPIIRVEGLSKKYLVGERRPGYDTLRDSLARTLKRPFAGKRRSKDSDLNTIWALKDVSFEVAPGEVVGIIGGNGAGKSTLLKVLSRITEPTEGRVELFGRLASLLEVGTGFHPELTGRDNIYLNGAVLGMRRAEIDSRFREIVAFAGIERFLDTPVKRYSSGMYMRLAFAVASHLDPEILLIDEVLAVGDAAFQKKCLGKASQIAKGGRTVLFVSHNLTAIKSLCRQTMRLNNGEIVDAGETEQVVLNYVQSGSRCRMRRQWEEPSSAPQGKNVRLHSVSVTPLTKNIDQPITVETPVRVDASFWNYAQEAVLNFSLILYNIEGIAVFNTGSRERSFTFGLVRGGFVIPGNFLNDGTYSIRLMIVRDASVVILDVNEVLTFEVQDSQREGNWFGKWIGAVRPKFDWQVSIEQ